MKFVQISVHFEYTQFVDDLLDKHQVIDYVRYAMMEGKDQEGKHFGSQIFPGNFTVYQAQVRDDLVDSLFDEMENFRSARAAHHHLQAIVLPIERCLRSPDTGST